MLYNNSFEVIDENTGVIKVEDQINTIQNLTTDKIVIQQAGFFEVFIDNQAQTPVYFDNLMVAHTEANVLEVNAYYPYGMIIPQLSLQASADKKNYYKYNAKELQEELELNWLDYGARVMTPSVGRWWVPDPLAENHYNVSPYLYAGNNPILFVDPDGMDWVHRIVDGINEYYYDRDVSSQDDITAKYGNNSDITHLNTGYTITQHNEDGSIKSQYTFTNDAKKNKYGTVTDINGNIMDNSQIIYGSDYTIFGTTNESVNAETLHKNLFGSSYIGNRNPATYGDKNLGIDPADSYQYRPTWSPTEMASYQHDLDYDALGVSGFWGVASPRTKEADVKLIYACKKVLKDPNSSSTEKSRARKIIIAFTYVVNNK